MRQTFFYKNYFEDFYGAQPEKVKNKIDWTIDVVRSFQRVPEQYLKHLAGTDGLYEIRVQVGNNIYRIFCFFDDGNIVVIGNAFQKKTQKTPKEQIDLASKIKKEYFYEKDANNNV